MTEEKVYKQIDVEVRGEIEVIRCQHLDDNKKGTVHRFVNIGTSRIVMLCGYCSGLLVESILSEFHPLKVK